MNQHSLHPSENLAPQNITICGVSFAPSIGVSLNAPNVKCNNLLALSAEIANTQRNGALLQGLLSQVLKALSNQVLWDSISFVMIFGMGRQTRKIEKVTRLCRKAQLWVARNFNKIKSGVFRQKKMQAANGEAFCNQPPALSLTNLSYGQVNLFNKEEKVQIQLALYSDRNCEFMCGRAVSNCEDTQISEKLAEAYQVELVLEGKKQLIT